MDISKLLDHLRRELADMDAAILSLERLQEKGVRRRHPLRAPAEIRELPATPKTTGQRQVRKDPVE